MKTKAFFYSFVTLLVMLVGCSKDDSDTPALGNATFIDQGYIPASVSVLTCAQMAAYDNGYVFVATSDGIWKNNLATKEWSRAGLEGKVVTAIYKHPAVANKFFAGIQTDYASSTKTLYISSDGCSSWAAVDNTPIDKLDGYHEDFFCFAARPNNPNHIYANLEGGVMIAVSTDGGSSWKRMNSKDESYIGYPCPIAFLPNNPNQLFQGAESPLDFAWLGRYDIDGSNPTLLTNFTKLVDMPTWSNRRPNELQTFLHTGSSIYVGQEGALSKVTGTTTQFIFKSDEHNFPYTYVNSIWVDPSNAKHIVFGGELNNQEQPMQVYETYDEGSTIKRYEDKLGMANPQVLEIVATDTYPAILFKELGVSRVKLVLFKPAN